MDNYALIQGETVEVHESGISTTHSMNFNQEKSGQVSAHEENGHITIEACEDGGGGGSELPCIDIMLPTLESSVQNEQEQQQENVESTVTYEHAKQNQYELHDDDALKLSNQCGRSELQESHNEIVELDNIRVIEVVDQSQVMEVGGNQVMEVNQDQVIVQTIETLTFETTTNESVENEEERLNSHIEVEEEVAVAKNCELEGGENGDLNPEEYSEDKAAMDASQFDGNIHHETVSDYVSEDYVDNNKEEEGEESLEQSNNDGTFTESQEYEHLKNISEIQLSNEAVKEEVSDEQYTLESNLMSASGESYEEYSNIRDSEETEINEEEETTAQQPITYRQENIINIAAASANIDIQDDTSRSPEVEVVQEENQLVHNEVDRSSIEEGVSIILNRGSGGGESVENRGGEMIMIQKGEENSNEIIEEIYFIQDVSSCSSNNFEHNKDVINVEEEEEEMVDQIETVITSATETAHSTDDVVENETVQSQRVHRHQVDLKTSSKNRSNITQSGISEKSRNVIQDIFDDWRDENVEEDNQNFAHKDQDTVEIELNNLLNENKKKMPVSKETQGTSKENLDVIPIDYKPTEAKKPMEIQTSSTPAEATSSSTKVARNSAGKDIPSYARTYVRGTYSSSSSSSTFLDDQDSKKKMQSSRLGIKVPNRPLKSRIASPAEVTEVLKERFREKQKDLESPQVADIVFVKKLTQRFASKICAGGTLPVPALIPLSHSRGSGSTTSDNLEGTESSTTQSNENTDNRELLAILEGDVDPDWSNLKSQSTEDSLGTEGDSTLSKLNPTIERELALKQLMEMPGSGNRRGKKKTFKPAPNKLQKKEEAPSTHDFKKEEILKIKDVKKTESVKQTKDSLSSSSSSTTPRKPLKENDSQNTPSMVSHTEIRRIDETRSGRKRKPTEKALEQYASKRQKIYKAKSPNKGSSIQTRENNAEKSLNKSSNSEKNNSLIENYEDTTTIAKKNVTSEVMPVSPSKEVTTIKKQATTTDKSVSPPPPLPPPKKDKGLVEKKPSSLVNESTPSPLSAGTRKKLIATKKLIPQRVLTLKKSSPLNLKPNLSTSPVVKRPVGRPAKVTVSKPVVAAVGKRLKKTEAPKPKRRKGGIKEIDRLLQDEGVVNLLYDVGQPRKRRLVPITKSQKKVMDIEKAERDLDLRKKLVKNAVLGLRSSDGEKDKIVAHRSKRRSSPLVNIAEAEENSTVAVTDRGKSSVVTSPTEFIYPAKIRNAADASVIVRRHSSSSFSSVSGSPRVSIDAPLEGGSNKPDDEHHGLRSGRRKHSIAVEKDVKSHLPDVKRSKRKVSQYSKSNDKVPDVSENKIALTKKQIKPVESNKKIEKSPRSSLDASEGSGNSESEKVRKVMTRSNGGTGLKKVLLPNQKKKAASIKDKSSAVSSDSASSAAEETTKSQDELSACLAEAATALSSVSSGGLSRRTSGGTTAAGRKNKGSTNVIKTLSDTADSNSSNNTKSESKPLFSNKEINVRRNGNLVQLILTPSSSKIINGITLEVMQELRDILTVLKTDQECRVVLLTSTGGTSFCEGLDLSTLLHTDKEKRKVHAEEMANAVKEFIKCLATFNKPLVAGVQGAAVGLGVTILPLFDLVIASDKATFYTPYGKLGQIPEGAAIMTLSHVHGSAVASELLLGGRTLTASEALRAGLVTRVLWPERFPLELLPSVKAMSEQSSQSMEATKALLRQSLRNKLNAALESETHILVQHWCSAECQAAIKAYIEKKVE